MNNKEFMKTIWRAYVRVNWEDVRESNLIAAASLGITGVHRPETTIIDYKEGVLPDKERVEKAMRAVQEKVNNTFHDVRIANFTVLGIYQIQID